MPTAAQCLEQNKIQNPLTKRCIAKDGAVAKQIASGSYARTNHKASYTKKYGVPCKQKCTGGTVCNPTSGLCILRNSANGKKIVANKNFKLNANSRFDWESNVYGHIFPHRAMKVHGHHTGKCKFGARQANGKCPPNPNPNPKTTTYKSTRKAPAKSARNFVGTTSLGSNGSDYLSTPYQVKGKTAYRWAKVKA